MTASSTISSRGYKWLQFIVLTTVLLIASAAIVVVAVSARRAIRAEENLHATIFTVCLVEQFVNDSGRWPTSWNELEGMRLPGGVPSPRNNEASPVRIGGARGYKWPAEAQYLQDCVNIDFSADVNALVSQDPMEFEAIRPIGPSYEYRDYGFVQSLQETLRRATEVPPATTKELVD